MQMNAEEGHSLARAVMHILDGWEIESADILNVLALPKTIHSRHLESFRQGNRSFPDDEAVMKRIVQIVGIADALRTTYPRNTHMASMWLNRPHRRFSNRSPKEVILNKGLSGLISIRAELDCEFAWRLAQNH